MSQHVQQHVNHIREAIGQVPPGAHRYVDQVAGAYAERDADIAEDIRSAADRAGVSSSQVEQLLRRTGLVVPERENVTPGSDFNGNGGVSESDGALGALQAEIRRQGQLIERLVSAAQSRGITV